MGAAAAAAVSGGGGGGDCRQGLLLRPLRLVGVVGLCAVVVVVVV
jgi:hypothetical protein